MEWLDRMNDALGYLEANLAGTADMEHAARLACCSVYHFGRMFSYIAGVPLSEYLRRRRMTLAAFDLQNEAGYWMWRYGMAMSLRRRLTARFKACTAFRRLQRRGTAHP